MASAFSALDALNSSAVDAAFGDTHRLVPKAKINSFGSPIESDSRKAVDFTGIFIEGTGSIGFEAGDRRIRDFEARTIRQDAYLTVDRSEFLASNLPRKDDQVVVADGRTFTIIDVLDDGEARLAMPLVRA